MTDTNRRLQDAGRDVSPFITICLSRITLYFNKTAKYQGCPRFCGVLVTVLLKENCPVCQVTAQTEEVIRCRVHQRNMATTVEKLQLCIPGASCVSVPIMTHCRATGLNVIEVFMPRDD